MTKTVPLDNLAPLLPGNVRVFHQTRPSVVSRNVRPAPSKAELFGASPWPWLVLALVVLVALPGGTA